MRRNVEEVVCDRCGKVTTGSSYGLELDLNTSLSDADGFLYKDLCPRCEKTVTKRLQEAGPLKGAPKGLSDVA